MNNQNQLINLCLKNDRKAQQELYELHFQFLMSICYRYTHNEQDAVALVNQAYLKVLQNLSTFDEAKPFLPWIKRIAINAAIDHIRKTKRHYNNTVFWEDESWDIESEMIAEELPEQPELTYEDYIAMLGEVTEPAQTIFNLYAIDECEHSEIAEKLNISVRTSKRYLAKARMELQQLISARTQLLKRA
jgi:RNA polymerase sigma-70 factor (ECF subfamily)